MEESRREKNIFNSKATEKGAELIIIPVPWEVTVSSRQGTSRAPEYLLEASKNISVYSDFKNEGEPDNIYMEEIDKYIKSKNDYLKSSAELIIGCKNLGKKTDCVNQLVQKLQEINEGCEAMNGWVHDITKRFLVNGKKIILLGGDQSTCYGYIKALTEIHGEFGILHIDAQPDLIENYEGFKYSHGSIMYNILNDIPQVKKVVQVGIRDLTKEEFQKIHEYPERVKTFFDQPIKERIYEGDNWKDIIEEVIAHLPTKVYISIDVAGLRQDLFPNSGMPIPGGIDIEVLYYMIKKIKKEHQIIGMDMTEISPGTQGHESIDPMIGARILNKLCFYFNK